MTNYSIYDDLDNVLDILNLSMYYVSYDEEVVEARNHLKTLYAEAARGIDNAERIRDKLTSGYIVLESKLSKYDGNVCYINVCRDEVKSIYSKMFNSFNSKDVLKKVIMETDIRSDYVELIRSLEKERCTIGFRVNDEEVSAIKYLDGILNETT